MIYLMWQSEATLILLTKVFAVKTMTKDTAPSAARFQLYSD